MKETFALKTVLSLDFLAGQLFWNVQDITVSSLCRQWRRGKLEQFKLYGWQTWMLSKLEPTLEWIRPGHCEQARLDDILRMQSGEALLQ